MSDERDEQLDIAADDGQAADDEEPSMSGRVFRPDSEAGLIAGLEQAFDYRGDTTLLLRDGTSVTGYIFDRRVGAVPGESNLRLMLESDGTVRTICYADVVEIRFAERDPAAGRSFQTWIRKYSQRKQRGEAANLYADPLDG
jgi:hypothetical protein